MRPGERIKSLRKERGIKQDKLAEMAGMSYRTLLRIERSSNYNPSSDIIKAIAAALNTTQAFLLGETDNPSPIFASVLQPGQMYVEGTSPGTRPWSVKYTDLSFGAGKTSFEGVEIIGKIIVDNPERLDYAARILGHSMEPEIPDRSLLLIQKVPPGILKSRDIAVCCFVEAQDWTVRRVFFHDGEIILRPNQGESESYPYIPECVQCFGKVIRWEENEEEIQKILAKLKPVK